MMGGSRAAIGSGTAVSSVSESDLLQGTTAAVHGAADAAALSADLAGAGPGPGSAARDARGRRHPGDHDRMTLRLFLNV
jgi:hypothetical protein